LRVCDIHGGAEGALPRLGQLDENLGKSRMAMRTSVSVIPISEAISGNLGKLIMLITKIQNLG